MVDDNTGIEGTEDQAASETSPSEEDEQAVVGDVTAGDQPGTFQVRKILDGEETTPAQ
jgi:hypothetical protein